MSYAVPKSAETWADRRPAGRIFIDLAASLHDEILAESRFLSRLLVLQDCRVHGQNKRRHGSAVGDHRQVLHGCRGNLGCIQINLYLGHT